jgi:phosphoglycolate phosphatase-like HAD superfamily hydrolase
LLDSTGAIVKVACHDLDFPELSDEQNTLRRRIFFRTCPHMLKELMDEFLVPPERILMIGDTTHDLQAVINAEVHVSLFLMVRILSLHLMSRTV